MVWLYSIVTYNNGIKQIKWTHVYIHTDVVQSDSNNCPGLSWLYYLMAKYEDCRVGIVMIPLKDVFSEYI